MELIGNFLCCYFYVQSLLAPECGCYVDGWYRYALSDFVNQHQTKYTDHKVTVDK